MAYCGTATLDDKEGGILYTIRRGCMPQGDRQLLCLAMAGDVFSILERRKGLKIKILADCAAEMWNLLEDAFPRALFGEVKRDIDFWHLIEKLARQPRSCPKKIRPGRSRSAGRPA